MCFILTNGFCRGGAWWNIIAYCVLHSSNIPETVPIWLYNWPSKIEFRWLLTIVGECCCWKICLLWSCTSLLGLAVEHGQFLWAPCALMRLSDNEQKGLPVLLPLLFWGCCTWFCIRHELVHWVGGASVGPCWGPLIFRLDNVILLICSWIQDMTGSMRHCGCGGSFHLPDIVWWTLNVLRHNWAADSLRWMWIVWCWPIILQWCWMPLALWGLPCANDRVNSPPLVAMCWFQGDIT